MTDEIASDSVKIFLITHRSIETGNIRPTVRFFEKCGASRAVALMNVGCVFLLVDGYDDDPRELYQIPAVRRFFARLWQAVPHLLFFLDPEGPDGDSGSALFVASMLHPGLDSSGARVDGGRWHTHIDGNWLAREFLEPGFEAMNAFARRHGIQPSDPPLCDLVGRLEKQLRAALTIGSVH